MCCAHALLACVIDSTTLLHHCIVFFNRQRELLGFLLQGAACVHFRAWVLAPLKGAAVVPV